MNRIIRKVSRILIILIASFVSHSSFAQLSTNNLTKYTELEGLPSMQVNRILADRFGYIWAGTTNGLTRYDGYQFKRFYSNPNEPGSIQGGVIWALFEDSKGQIWTSAEPSRLNVYNPLTKSFKHYDFSHLIEHEVDDELVILTINEADNGRLYFGVDSKYYFPITSALLYLDEKEDILKRVEPDKGTNVDNIVSSTKDKQGNIWFTSFTGLIKLDKEGSLVKVDRQAFSFLTDEYPTGVISDTDHIWSITNFSRLFEYDPSTKKCQVYTPVGLASDNFLNNLSLDPAGNIWMGTNKGLFLFDRKKKTVQGFNADANKNIEGAIITDVEYDSFGSLWIGTQTSGMFKYEEKSVFKSYSHDKNVPASLTPGWADNIFETRDGKVVITTSGVGEESGINELDLQRKTIHPMPFKSLLPGTYSVHSILEDSAGGFYMRLESGLHTFSLHNRSFKKAEIAGLPDSIYHFSMVNDKVGNQWVGTTTGLFRRKSGVSSFQRYDLSRMAGSTDASNWVIRIIESKKHGVWLLTNDGLFLFNYQSDQILRKGFDEKLGDIFVTQDINSLYEDSSGMAWVGTWQGGLSHYNPESGEIKTYTINDGLPSMSIQSILADEQNQNLWLATFEGLSRFHILTKQFYNYSTADGIQSQLFADGSFLKTSNGLFFFGGSNGVTMFDPNQVNDTSLPPKVYLTDLKLFNRSVIPGENSILKQPIYDTKEIILEHNQNNISLEFIALHYSNPSKNKYSYRLENYDDGWREVANFQEAFYPNLPPGEYRFHVKAANNNGVWNEKGAALKIVINPPWWKTSLAYVLFGVLFAGGVYGAHRYFRHRLLEREREKARTRELAQAKEIEKAYTELKATQSLLIQSEKMASLGELTAGIAHEIQNPLNFVNNFSEISSELLDEMEREIDNGNFEGVKEIKHNVKHNLEKILHHGKRADGIVKGMLQHSRSSSGGVKEPTDINALTDEYMRLAYHGLRAKDKSFNATMKTAFDESIRTVNIIPQDIGRVMLNLLNNAFYAVSEKKKKSIEPFEPTVSVTTKKIQGNVEITVKDNGDGIPQKALDKIFQPFFTTKPTGQGTGLGLSLSYDIIKAHGGEINVRTSEDAGSEFIITLPRV